MRLLCVTFLILPMLLPPVALGYEKDQADSATTGKAESLATSGSPAWLGKSGQETSEDRGVQVGGDQPESNCWSRAAQRYGVDAWLLYSIAEQESSLNPRAFHRNNDGTYDIGEMQINSSLLPALRRYGIRADDLWEPCLNIHVGAWVLADCSRANGLSWESVGAYNAGGRRTKRAEIQRARYARNIYRIYSRHMRLFHNT
jgi:soluble lytic murein transglycosylase-like protein